MFAQATSNNNATAASSIRSIGAARPLISSCSDFTLTPMSVPCASG